jgi:thiol:disulfide interchange protein
MDAMRGMGFLACCLLVAGALPPAAAAGDYAVSARWARTGSTWQVAVELQVDEPWHVYADGRLEVRLDGQSVTGRFAPPAISLPDGFGGSDPVYTGRVNALFGPMDGAQPVRVQVTSQACSDKSCLPPRTFSLVLAPAGYAAVTGTEATAEDAATNSDWLAGARIAATATGYLPADEFRAFLARARGIEAAAPAAGRWRQFLENPAGFLARHGEWVTLLLVLVGGLLLNLTPCVLPMIPINLAIIGAGVRAGSRRRGLLLGTAYGAGMALVYGVLGVVVVLTGGVFGALQSSPFFSLTMAVLFAALSLAMFDVIPLDLSRFQSGGAAGRGMGAALVAGGVSSLLAGACVAPVVTAVLLLSGSLYHDGSKGLALLLPFLLGIGMALPWPFAGAGLSVLPKPGGWMVWVKHGFGILIAIMGLYYGWLAYTGFAVRHEAGELLAGDQEGWRQRLEQARVSRKPLLLDFKASWCKSCHKMDRTTFRDPAVRKLLEQFVFVRISTEDPSHEPAVGMVRAFGVSGLPTYIVVEAH